MLTPRRLVSKTVLVLTATALVPVCGNASAESPQSARPSQIVLAAKPGKAPAKPPKPRGKGARQMFDEAMKLYDAGKYEQALGAFDAIVKKYPGHEPARLQIAKTLYRMDRIKEAYGVFQQVNPQHLDPETSYEYGWSFYTMKQWDGALYAFQRLPKGHALYDLANYYGGICAIKLRKYDDAEDMLDKAVVLPDKLAKSRALYIKHVQALRLIQQRSSLAKEREGEANRIKDSNKKARDEAAAAMAAGASPPPKGYEHKGRMAIDKSASVAYAVQHQYFDNHGLKETTYDARIASFNLASGFLAPLPMKQPKDRQAAAGLHLTLGAEDRVTKGDEQRVVINESQADLARVIDKDLGTKDYKAGTAGAGAWIEFPLPEEFWLALGADVSFTYVDFERGKRTGTRDGYASIGGITGTLDFEASGTYTEYLDPKTKPNLTETTGKVQAQMPVIDKLSGRVIATYKLFDYLSDQGGLDGPDSSTSLDLSLNQDMPFGFSFRLSGIYEFQTNATYHKVPTYGTLAADGEVLSGKAELTADPFPWLSISVQQLISKTTWTLDNEQARDQFELRVPDYIEDFTAKAALNLAF